MIMRAAAGTLALSALLAGCATSDQRWRALSREGPLVRWAACMESDGYRAWSAAGMGAAAAADEGATPISSGEILRIGLAECEALGGATLAALSHSARRQLYEDAERRLHRKLAQSHGRN